MYKINSLGTPNVQISKTHVRKDLNISVILESITMEYFRKKRIIIFPEITDWTDDHNELRYKHPNNMSYSEWFWFHPSAFKLMKYGIPIIGITHFLAASFLLYFKFNLKALSFICGFIALWCCYQFYKAYIELKIAKDMNFYDLYLRDYGVL